MKKHSFFILLYILPFLGFSQGVKVSLYDKFLKKQRVEMEPLALSGLTAKNKVSISYSAIASSLYFIMSGTGWGTTTIDNGDELVLLFSNDSVVVLKSTSLQSFEPDISNNTYRHQYNLTNDDLEALSKFDLVSVRKYSFENYSDITIPKVNSEKLKQLSSLFVAELKKANLFKSLRQISLKDIRNHIGDSVEFCSKIYRTRYFQESENGPTLLDVQGDFSDPFVNVVILEKDRAKFNNAPEKRYLNKDVCISGVVTLHNNIPYMVVHSQEQIKLRSPISLNEVDLFEGDSVTVSGKVFTARYLEESKTKPTLLNVGAPHPDQPLTLVIENENRSNFNRPEVEYFNKTVRVTGKVVSFKHKAQILLYSQNQVEVLPDQDAVSMFTSVEENSAKASIQKSATFSGGEKQTLSSDAMFPGGAEAFFLFLKNNLKNPVQLNINEQVRVVASFKIDVDGTCKDVQIAQSAGLLMDNEVKRVLTAMPKWKPALRNGNVVEAMVTQPITFRGEEKP